MPCHALQVYQHVGADPHAFMGAAIEFLKQETAFHFPPGTDDPAAQLAQLQLPSATAAAASGAAAVAGAQAAAPATDAAAPAAEATPQEAQAVQEVEMVAQEEEAEQQQQAPGPSALSESGFQGACLPNG